MYPPQKNSVSCGLVTDDTVHLIKAGGQRRKVTHNEMPTQSITDGDDGGFYGTEVHGGGRLVPSDNTKADTMPGVWSGNHRGVHDSTPPPNEHDWARNRLELANGHPDSTPTPGIRTEISADDETVSLLLSRMPGILPYVEWPALSLQQAALGGPDKYTRGAPQPPPYGTWIP